MAKVVGVRFRTAGKIYYFDPKDLELPVGTHVIVETERALEYGKVTTAPFEVDDSEIVKPLRNVIRAATPRDEERNDLNRFKEREAFQICREKIAQHGLEMKLVAAEYTFDNKKLLFYFTADGRVDFRELVKDLAGEFRTRIELRQIGVRDETKIMGGVGICGRELCCHTYLCDFAPVSIKMAKEQNLSLNPAKISGVCGRLMCCLNNEAETYEHLNSNLPRTGDLVKTGDGIEGEVQNVNVLRQLVKVVVEVNGDKEIREYPASEVTFISHKKNRRKNGKEETKEAQEEEKKVPGKEKHSHGEKKENSSKKSDRENFQKQDGKKSSRKKENRESSQKKGNKSSQKQDGNQQDRRKENRPASGEQKDSNSAGKQKSSGLSQESAAEKESVRKKDSGPSMTPGEKETDRKQAAGSSSLKPEGEKEAAVQKAIGSALTPETEKSSGGQSPLKAAGGQEETAAASNEIHSSGTNARSEGAAETDD